MYRGTVLPEGNLELKGLKCRACVCVCVCVTVHASLCGGNIHTVCLLVVDVVCTYDII